MCLICLQSPDVKIETKCDIVLKRSVLNPDNQL